MLNLRSLALRTRMAYYSRLSTGRFEGDRPHAISPVLLLGPGRIRAQGAQLGVWPSPRLTDSYIHIEARASDTSIVIGAGSIINNGVVIIGEGPGIEIGRDVLMGPGVEIFDSDFHALDPHGRKEGVPKYGRVVVGDNVFIGSGVRIGKGVTIGQNTVIGMGSVVVNDIPADAVAVGNPCRMIRSLAEP